MNHLNETFLRMPFLLWEETFPEGVLDALDLTMFGFNRDGTPASIENPVYIEFKRNLGNNFVLQPIGGARINYAPRQNFNPLFLRATLKPRDKNDPRPFVEVGVPGNREGRNYTFRIYSTSKD